MWQSSTNDYKKRIRQELAEQTNAQFLYFLLQESIRLLEIGQQQCKKSLSWFAKNYRSQKIFIKHSQSIINGFKQLSQENKKFQLDKLFISLSSTHGLLRENCGDESILAFVDASEEARRYNDFSGIVHYAIRHPVVKFFFELSSEYYQKNIKKMYQQADELALVPRIQYALGLHRIPHSVKQSVFYRMGQSSKVEEMWLDAAYPRRLATSSLPMTSHLNIYSEISLLSPPDSYKRCNDLRKQADLLAKNTKKSLSILCRIHEDSSLIDIEKAAKRIKRLTIVKKTGRRSIISLVQELKILQQFNHDVFLTLKSLENFKIILKKINGIQKNIKKRIRHLQTLALMANDLELILSLGKLFDNFIFNIQQQAYYYTIEEQFIHQSQSLPAGLPH